MSIAVTPPRATLADLMRTEGKAELIGGKVVQLMPTGSWPSRVAGRIYRYLDDHAEATGRGVVHTDNAGFTVPELSSGRETFSPDVSYHTGYIPAKSMKFVAGPPDFAAEVRSENDYGPAADAAYAAKRADYFEAGTLVVWDVDPEAGTIRGYRRGEPEPTLFGPGDEADPEPAVPGWRVAVDRLFA